MEFWSFSKMFVDYDDDFKDAYSMYYKTEEEAIQAFNDNMQSYLDDYELEENEYEFHKEKELYKFELEMSFCYVRLMLEKIYL